MWMHSSGKAKLLDRCQTLNMVVQLLTHISGPLP